MYTHYVICNHVLSHFLPFAMLMKIAISCIINIIDITQADLCMHACKVSGMCIECYGIPPRVGAVDRTLISPGVDRCILRHRNGCIPRRSRLRCCTSPSLSQGVCLAMRRKYVVREYMGRLYVHSECTKYTYIQGVLYHWACCCWVSSRQKEIKKWIVLVRAWISFATAF